MAFYFLSGFGNNIFLENYSFPLSFKFLSIIVYLPFFCDFSYSSARIIYYLTMLSGDGVGDELHTVLCAGSLSWSAHLSSLPPFLGYRFILLSCHLGKEHARLPQLRNKVDLD